MNSPPGTTVTSEYDHNANTPQSPAEHRGPLWKAVLSSPRESADYRESLVGLMGSETERDKLYELKDDDGEIDQIVNLLYLESKATTSNLEEKKRIKAFIILRRMCRLYDRFPSSFVIQDGITLEGSYAYASGGYGDVYKAQYKGKLVAVKAMKIFRPQGDIDAGIRKSRKLFCGEALLWERLSHQNLVPLLGINETLFGLALISEWMECGTILQFVNNNLGTNRLKLLHDVSSGLQYLHGLRIIHSDLKSGNILVDSSPDARICDFGLGGFISTASMRMSTSTPPSGGTYRWMAPELLKEHRKSSKESDVYSFGMVAYEVFTGWYPFNNLRGPSSDYVIARKVLGGERPPRPLDRERLGLDDEVWAKIQECWKPEPQDRPSIKDVQAFLEPLHQKWIPIEPDAIAELNSHPPAATGVGDTRKNWSTSSKGSPEVPNDPGELRVEMPDATRYDLQKLSPQSDRLP